MAQTVQYILFGSLSFREQYRKVCNSAALAKEVHCQSSESLDKSASGAGCEAVIHLKLVYYGTGPLPQPAFSGLT